MNFLIQIPTGPRNFHLNRTMFKANISITITGKKREMAVKTTVDRSFLQGQSVEPFRDAIRSQATGHPYEIRLLLRTNSGIGSGI